MLEDLVPPVFLPSCKVRSVLEQLEKSDAEILKNLIDSQNLWKPYALERALSTKGIDLGSKSISRHRKGECSCLRILK